MSVRLDFARNEVRTYASGIAVDVGGLTRFLAYKEVRQFTSDGGGVSIWVRRRLARRLMKETNMTSSRAQIPELT